jgi:predicted AlkP superfamily phosphohydrolase/phosphomutase
MADRVLVIGLDGGTWTILQPYMEAGLLPSLAALCQRSFRATLRTVLPPITPTAWTSMATGVNPGKHRIFGFGTYRDAKSGYIGQPVHRRDVAVPTLWRILSDRGLTSRIVNVPMTYPPEQISGSIVSGMFTPGPEAAYAWPPDLKDELAAAGIEPRFATDLTDKRRASGDDVLTQTIEGDASILLDQVDDLTRRHHQVACHLIRKDWQFFMAVYQATDLIQHMLWGDLLPPPIDHTCTPRAQRIARSLRLVDDCAGELVDLAGSDAMVMLVSDHGFGRCLGEYALGQWLISRGYMASRSAGLAGLARNLVRRLGLRLLLRRALGQQRADRISSRTFPILWSQTKAFLDSNAAGQAICINVRGRFPEGLVEPGEPCERLRDELIAELHALRINGVSTPPIPQAVKREDVYAGPFVSEAPDVLLVPNGDALVSFVNGQPNAEWLKPAPAKAGVHLMEGIFSIAGPGVRTDRQIARASIVDIAPTVLALLGLPVPDYMDGRALTEAFIDSLDVKTQSSEADHDPSTSQRRDQVFSEDEQAVIEERLRNLGYLG